MHSSKWQQACRVATLRSRDVLIVERGTIQPQSHQSACSASPGLDTGATAVP